MQLKVLTTPTGGVNNVIVEIVGSEFGQDTVIAKLEVRTSFSRANAELQFFETKHHFDGHLNLNQRIEEAVKT